MKITTKALLFLMILIGALINANAFAAYGGTTGIDCRWDLSDEGDLVIKPVAGKSVGTFNSLSADSNTSAPWYEYRNDIKTARFEGTIYAGSSLRGLFFECGQLESVDLTGLNTSNTTSTFRMFSDCVKLEQLDLSGIDTTKVKQMYGMFINCQMLKSIDLSGMTGNSVTNMSEMFSGCSSLTELDLSEMTAKKANNMSGTFKNCSSLTELDLSGMTGENVTNMQKMFQNCSSLTELDISGMTGEKVTNMSSMFENCSSLTELDLSGMTGESATNMSNMFSGCSSLTELDISGVLGEKVTNMSGTFSGCSSLTELDLSRMTGEKVTNMSGMFRNCSSLTQIDLSGMTGENVTSMSGMFSGCSSLTQVDISGMTGEKVTNMSYMFYECSSIKEIDFSDFNASAVKNMSVVFSGCSSLRFLDLSGIDTTNVTNMDGLFNNTYIKTIVLGEKTDLKMTDSSVMACSFGRGTWLREEDGKEYSIVEINKNSSNGTGAGTYTKISNISKDMAVTFPVTYSIGAISQIDEFSTDDPDVFELSSNKKRISMKLNDLYADNTEVTVPGSAQVLFKNVVTSKDNKKYDLKLIIDNITFYDTGDQHVSGYTNILDVGVVLNSISFPYGIYGTKEDCDKIKNGVRVNDLNFGRTMDITMQVVDNDGNPMEGSFIFSIYDLDHAAARDKDSIYKSTENGRGYGDYSEGVNLISGFDIDTLTLVEDTFLITDDDFSPIHPNRITGSRIDNESEFSEFVIQADAENFKFMLTMGRMNIQTTALSYYQPQIVKIEKQNESGELVQGAQLELHYWGTDTPVEEWVTTTEPKTLFLVPGRYTLKEKQAPQGYEMAEDIEFFVDTDYKVTVNGNDVDKIVMQDVAKPATIIVHHYIINESGEKTTIKLANDENYTKKYYSSYETEPTDLTGLDYEIAEIPDNASGTILTDPTVITYYYRAKTYHYTVNYIDKNTNKSIHSPKVVTVKNKDDEIFSSGEIIDINNYKYDSVDKEKLVISVNNEENVINIYYIPNTSYYTVNYINKNTNESINSPKVVKDKNINDEIISSDEIIDINNYKYDSVDKEKLVISADGEENVINIYYVKKSSSVSKGRVVVKYIDKLTGRELSEKEILSGKIDSSYSCNEKEIAGYRLVEDTGNTVGKYKTKDIEVKYYYEPVYSLKKDSEGHHEWYLRGYEDYTFRMNNQVTREEIATIFYRLTVSSDNDMRQDYVVETDPYSDVAKDRWSARPIAYMKQLGIMNGYEDGSFKPTSPITRAEFAQVIMKYSQDKLQDTDLLEDVNDDHWASQAIRIALSEGWVIGYEDNTYRPQKSITRVETVTIINRMLKRKASSETISEVKIPVVDLDKNHWGYADILEAITRHDYTINKEGEEVWDSYSYPFHEDMSEAAYNDV